ncbi:MAG: amidase [Myxococcota bacterium]
MAWSPLLDLSALEQARYIRERKISSEELTRLYLARIEALNPKLNAFVRVHRRRALAQARRKDAEVRSGRGELPAFHGVPSAMKDLNFVRGSVSRFGSRAVWIPSPVDCHSTASMRLGGFVILGKTATSELGAMPVTEPDIHPPTRNPWDLERTSGGSSGGAGAAVAGGLLPIAHGSDGAGSVRIPASLCQLYGFKPTRGRVANAYGLRDPDILYTCGPLARSVEDAAAMLDVLGRTGDLRAALASPPRRLQIGVLTHSSLAPTHPEIAEAVRGVAKRLESLGHSLGELRAPEGSVDEFLPVYQRQVRLAPAMLPWRLQPVPRWLRDAGKHVSGASARSIQHGLAKRVLDAMSEFDLCLTPTVPIETPRVGEFRDSPASEAFARAALLGVYTATSNISGAPSASIPMGRMSSRWPMGAHLIGPIGADALVLQVSRQLEDAMPWRADWAPAALG